VASQSRPDYFMPEIINSLKRGLHALALINKRMSLTASELGMEFAIPRTSARRVLDTLAEQGFLEKSDSDGRYRLTPVVKSLSAGLHEESLIARAAEPLLARAVHEIGWRLAITTPSGTNMIVRVATTRLPGRSHRTEIAPRTPMLHGSSGYVILAFLPAAQRDRLLRMLEKSRDPRQSIARDPAALMSSLKRVRRMGFACRRYLEYPEASAGVPIFHHGVVRACLLMNYPKAALTEHQVSARYIPTLWDLASEIELQVSGPDFVSRGLARSERIGMGVGAIISASGAEY
jgi:DNA-binding IclR family transcriptional regulator